MNFITTPYITPYIEQFLRGELLTRVLYPGSYSISRDVLINSIHSIALKRKIFILVFTAEDKRYLDFLKVPNFLIDDTANLGTYFYNGPIYVALGYNTFIVSLRKEYKIITKNIDSENILKVG